MKTTWMAAMPAVCAWAALVFCADESPAGKNYEPEQGFVVHEWGLARFDADGNPMPAKQDFPGFVHQEAPLKQEAGSFGKPVVFFYAPEKMTLDFEMECSVESKVVYHPAGKFKTYIPGAKSEWAEARRRFSIHGLAVDPKGSVVDLQAVDKNHWWTACRNAGACVITSVLKENGQSESEKFFFYEVSGGTGGNVTVAWEPDGAAVSNGNDFDVTDLFVTDGKAVYAVDVVKAGKTVQLKPSSELAAEQALRGGLKNAGLYDKEIEAFFAAWKKDLLDAPGARAWYRIPNAAYERHAKLAFSVPPKSFQRAMYVTREIRR